MVPMPAFAMTTSSLSIPCSVRKERTAARASDSLELSSSRTMRWLVREVGMVVKDLEDSLEGERTQAMTVVEGRARRVVTRALPRPKARQ